MIISLSSFFCIFIALLNVRFSHSLLYQAPVSCRPSFSLLFSYSVDDDVNYDEIGCFKLLEVNSSLPTVCGHSLWKDEARQSPAPIHPMLFSKGCLSGSLNLVEIPPDFVRIFGSFRGEPIAKPHSLEILDPVSNGLSWHMNMEAPNTFSSIDEPNLVLSLPFISLNHSITPETHLFLFDKSRNGVVVVPLGTPIHRSACCFEPVRRAVQFIPYTSTTVLNSVHDLVNDRSYNRSDIESSNFDVVSSILNNGFVEQYHYVMRIPHLMSAPGSISRELLHLNISVLNGAEDITHTIVPITIPSHGDCAHFTSYYTRISINPNSRLVPGTNYTCEFIIFEILGESLRIKLTVIPDAVMPREFGSVCPLYVDHNLNLRRSIGSPSSIFCAFIQDRPCLSSLPFEPIRYDQFFEVSKSLDDISIEFIPDARSPCGGIYPGRSRDEYLVDDKLGPNYMTDCSNGINTDCSGLAGSFHPVYSRRTPPWASFCSFLGDLSHHGISIPPSTFHIRDAHWYSAFFLRFTHDIVGRIVFSGLRLIKEKKPSELYGWDRPCWSTKAVYGYTYIPELLIPPPVELFQSLSTFPSVDTFSYPDYSEQLFSNDKWINNFRVLHPQENYSATELAVSHPLGGAAASTVYVPLIDQLSFSQLVSLHEFGIGSLSHPDYSDFFGFEYEKHDVRGIDEESNSFSYDPSVAHHPLDAHGALTKFGRVNGASSPLNDDLLLNSDDFQPSIWERRASNRRLRIVEGKLLKRTVAGDLDWSLSSARVMCEHPDHESDIYFPLDDGHANIPDGYFMDHEEEWIEEPVGFQRAVSSSSRLLRDSESEYVELDILEDDLKLSDNPGMDLPINLSLDKNVLNELLDGATYRLKSLSRSDGHSSNMVPFRNLESQIRLSDHQLQSSKWSGGIRVKDPVRLSASISFWTEGNRLLKCRVYLKSWTGDYPEGYYNGTSLYYPDRIGTSLSVEAKGFQDSPDFFSTESIVSRQSRASKINYLLDSIRGVSMPGSCSLDEMYSYFVFRNLAVKYGFNSTLIGDSQWVEENMDFHDYDDIWGYYERFAHIEGLLISMHNFTSLSDLEDRYRSELDFDAGNLSVLADKENYNEFNCNPFVNVTLVPASCGRQCVVNEEIEIFPCTPNNARICRPKSFLFVPWQWRLLSALSFSRPERFSMFFDPSFAMFVLMIVILLFVLSAIIQFYFLPSLSSFDLFLHNSFSISAADSEVLFAAVISRSTEMRQRNAMLMATKLFSTHLLRRNHVELDEIVEENEDIDMSIGETGSVVDLNMKRTLKAQNDRQISKSSTGSESVPISVPDSRQSLSQNGYLTSAPNERHIETIESFDRYSGQASPLPGLPLGVSHPPLDGSPIDLTDQYPFSPLSHRLPAVSQVVRDSGGELEVGLRPPRSPHSPNFRSHSPSPNTSPAGSRAETPVSLSRLFFSKPAKAIREIPMQAFMNGERSRFFFSRTAHSVPSSSNAQLQLSTKSKQLNGGAIYQDGSLSQIAGNQRSTPTASNSAAKNIPNALIHQLYSTNPPFGEYQVQQAGTNLLQLRNAQSGMTEPSTRTPVADTISVVSHPRRSRMTGSPSRSRTHLATYDANTRLTAVLDVPQDRLINKSREFRFGSFVLYKRYIAVVHNVSFIWFTVLFLFMWISMPSSEYFDYYDVPSLIRLEMRPPESSWVLFDSIPALFFDFFKYTPYLVYYAKKIDPSRPHTHYVDEESLDLVKPYLNFTPEKAFDSFSLRFFRPVDHVFRPDSHLTAMMRFIAGLTILMWIFLLFFSVYRYYFMHSYYKVFKDIEAKRRELQASSPQNSASLGLLQTDIELRRKILKSIGDNLNDSPPLNDTHESQLKVETFPPERSTSSKRSKRDKKSGSSKTAAEESLPKKSDTLMHDPIVNQNLARDLHLLDLIEQGSSDFLSRSSDAGKDSSSSRFSTQKKAPVGNRGTVDVTVDAPPPLTASLFLNSLKEMMTSWRKSKVGVNSENKASTVNSDTTVAGASNAIQPLSTTVVDSILRAYKHMGVKSKGSASPVDMGNIAAPEGHTGDELTGTRVEGTQLTKVGGDFDSTALDINLRPSVSILNPLNQHQVSKETTLHLLLGNLHHESFSPSTFLGNVVRFSVQSSYFQFFIYALSLLPWVLIPSLEDIRCTGVVYLCLCICLGVSTITGFFLIDYITIIASLKRLLSNFIKSKFFLQLKITLKSCWKNILYVISLLVTCFVKLLSLFVALLQFLQYFVRFLFISLSLLSVSEEDTTYCSRMTWLPEWWKKTLESRAGNRSTIQRQTELLSLAASHVQGTIAPMDELIPVPQRLSTKTASYGSLAPGSEHSQVIYLDDVSSGTLSEGVWKDHHERNRELDALKDGVVSSTVSSPALTGSTARLPSKKLHIDSLVIRDHHDYEDVKGSHIPSNFSRHYGSYSTGADFHPDSGVAHPDFHQLNYDQNNEGQEVILANPLGRIASVSVGSPVVSSPSATRRTISHAPGVPVVTPILALPEGLNGYDRNFTSTEVSEVTRNAHSSKLRITPNDPDYIIRKVAQTHRSHRSSPSSRSSYDKSGGHPNDQKQRFVDGNDISEGVSGSSGARSVAASAVASATGAESASTSTGATSNTVNSKSSLHHLDPETGMRVGANRMPNANIATHLNHISNNRQLGTADSTLFGINVPSIRKEPISDSTFITPLKSSSTGGSRPHQDDTPAANLVALPESEIVSDDGGIVITNISPSEDLLTTGFISSGNNKNGVARTSPSTYYPHFEGVGTPEDDFNRMGTNDGSPYDMLAAGLPDNRSPNRNGVNTPISGLESPGQGIHVPGSGSRSANSTPDVPGSHYHARRLHNVPLPPTSLPLSVEQHILPLSEPGHTTLSDTLIQTVLTNNSSQAGIRGHHHGSSPTQYSNQSMDRLQYSNSFSTSLLNTQNAGQPGLTSMFVSDVGTRSIEVSATSSLLARRAMESNARQNHGSNFDYSQTVSNSSNFSLDLSSQSQLLSQNTSASLPGVRGRICTCQTCSTVTIPPPRKSSPPNMNSESSTNSAIRKDKKSVLPGNINSQANTLTVSPESTADESPSTADTSLVRGLALCPSCGGSVLQYSASDAMGATISPLSPASPNADNNNNPQEGEAASPSTGERLARNLDSLFGFVKLIDGAPTISDIIPTSTSMVARPPPLPVSAASQINGSPLAGNPVVVDMKSGILPLSPNMSTLALNPQTSSDALASHIVSTTPRDPPVGTNRSNGLELMRGSHKTFAALMHVDEVEDESASSADQDVSVADVLSGDSVDALERVRRGGTHMPSQLLSNGTPSIDVEFSIDEPNHQVVDRIPQDPPLSIPLVSTGISLHFRNVGKDLRRDPSDILDEELNDEAIQIDNTPLFPLENVEEEEEEESNDKISKMISNHKKDVAVLRSRVLIDVDMPESYPPISSRNNNAAVPYEEGPNDFFHHIDAGPGVFSTNTRGQNGDNISERKRLQSTGRKESLVFNSAGEISTDQDYSLPDVDWDNLKSLPSLDFDTIRRLPTVLREAVQEQVAMGHRSVSQVQQSESRRIKAEVDSSEMEPISKGSDRKDSIDTDQRVALANAAAHAAMTMEQSKPSKNSNSHLIVDVDSPSPVEASLSTPLLSIKSPHFERDPPPHVLESENLLERPRTNPHVNIDEATNSSAATAESSVCVDGMAKLNSDHTPPSLTQPLWNSEFNSISNSHTNSNSTSNSATNLQNKLGQSSNKGIAFKSPAPSSSNPVGSPPRIGSPGKVNHPLLHPMTQLSHVVAPSKSPGAFQSRGNIVVNGQTPVVSSYKQLTELVQSGGHNQSQAVQMRILITQSEIAESESSRGLGDIDLTPRTGVVASGFESSSIRDALSSAESPIVVKNTAVGVIPNLPVQSESRYLEPASPNFFPSRERSTHLIPDMSVDGVIPDKVVVGGGSNNLRSGDNNVPHSLTSLPSFSFNFSISQFPEELNSVSITGHEENDIESDNA